MKTANESLAELKVVDLGMGLSGALVARMLADAGATVHRAEPAFGDPFYNSYSAYETWQRGKSISTATDIGNALADMADKLSEADVCIVGGEDYPGLDWRPNLQRLAESYPRLVILNMTSGRHDGPEADRPAVDILAQARSGIVHEIYPDRAALLGFPAPSYGVALQGLVGIAAALCEREHSGLGQIVHTSMFEGALSWLTHFWTQPERSDRSMEFVMPKGSHPLIFRCSDGKYLHFTMGTHNARLNIYTLLGIDDPTVADDPRGLPSMARGVRNFYGDIDLLQSYVDKWNRDDLLNELWALGLPAEAVNAPGEAWDDEQVALNGVIQKEPDGGRRVGLPFRLNINDAAAKAQGDGGRKDAPPLAGVRIVDFGSFTAGPHASMILADLGAEVIKVEPLTGDPNRAFFRPFTASSRGKRAIMIDVKQPEGREIALRLCRSADMVHHNFRPGVTKRLGIDVDTLSKLKPELILLENSGYGAEGPNALRGGLDMVFQAFCGHEQRCAGEGNAPFGFRSTTIDFAAGILGSIAALIAQYQKQRSGSGATIATSLLDTGIYLLSELVQKPDGSFLPLPLLNGEQTGFHPAEQLYRARDGWIAIAARGDDMARRLVNALGLEGLIVSPRDKWGKAEAAFIAEAVAGRDVTSLLAALTEADVWAERCRDDAETATLNDPFFRKGGTILRAIDPRYGEVLEIGTQFSFSRSPTTGRGDSPLLGEHSREILAEAGYSDAEIEGFISSGVVKTAN